jgi:hypothetical protein
VNLSEVRQTDEDGLVRFEALGQGSYYLACRRADCWPKTVEVELQAEHSTRLDVQMRRLADLELTVFAQNGLPATGVDVELTSVEFGSVVQDWLTQQRVRGEGLRTDSHGKILIQGMPRGPYTWSIPAAEGPPSGTIELLPAKTNVLGIQLPQ